MSASTRRAALGAILAAPLASVPVVAAIPPAAYEADFIALMIAATPTLREHDRLWKIACALYRDVEREFPWGGGRWQLREASEVWAAYDTAWQAASAVHLELEDTFERFQGRPMVTERGVLMKMRLGRTLDGLFEDDSWHDLARLFEEGTLCA
ncbi:hypothetical protein [Methylobacterium sp. GC_Met_2]|uniref:hypothetical protein n=1 Tax=Methylobacterium sp. GC_Met_2 TaxID=2937376 RepID=UPI00226B07B6|nr:hypothetical protein [Methylobacterium sp. GC_Met_2]